MRTSLYEIHIFLHHRFIAEHVGVQVGDEVIPQDADVAVGKFRFLEFSGGDEALYGGEAHSGDGGAVGAAQDDGDAGEALVFKATRRGRFGYFLGIQVVYIETE